MKIAVGSHNELNCELDGIAAQYEKAGAEVVRVKSMTPDSVFVRDVCAWTPFGYIQCNMAKLSRWWEPKHFLKECGIKPALTLPEGAYFEGADLLWINSDVCLLATGQRTNIQGFRVVGEWLTSRGVYVTCAGPLPSWHKQHLLGLCNIIREQNDYTIYSLENVPIGRTILPECDYPLKGPNWVQIGDIVYISEGAYKTAEVLCMNHRTLSFRTLTISKLLHHRGGLACASNILIP